jgi:hypothetical protein
MANICVCDIVANFPYLKDLGIISASLRTNRDIVVTSDGLALYGPSFGDLSITAYGDYLDTQKLTCPAKAGASYTWDKRYECDTTSHIIVYFIPRGRIRSYQEGEVNSNISLKPVSSHASFSASASSGPTTVFIKQDHIDAYDFTYSGGPIPLVPDDAYYAINIDFLDPLLPAGSSLYVQSFSWDYTPPQIPTLSYSFLFSYIE